MDKLSTVSEDLVLTRVEEIDKEISRYEAYIAELKDERELLSNDVAMIKSRRELIINPPGKMNKS